MLSNQLQPRHLAKVNTSKALTSDLVGAYLCNVDSSQLYDSSLQRRDAFFENSYPSWAYDYRGLSPHFVGSDYATIEDVGYDWTTGDGITICAWFKETYNFYQVYIAERGNNFAFVKDGNSGDRLRFTFRNAGVFTHEYKTDSAVITNGTWQHVAVSYVYGDGSSIRLFVNGVPVSGSWTIGNGNASPDTGTDITIGNVLFPTLGQYAAIQNLLIYKRALGDAEIRLLATQPYLIYEVPPFVPMAEPTGVLGGGECNCNEVCNPSVDGGALCGGDGITQAIYNETGSGGVVCAGDSQNGLGYSEIGSGGLLAAGDSDYGLQLEVIPSGGILAGSSADVWAIYEVLPDGGAVVAGDSSSGLSFDETGSGGVVCAGEADNEVFMSMDGGAVAGGSADVSAIYEVLPDGGAVCAGDAFNGNMYDEVGSGGVVCAGDSDSFTWGLYRPTVSGGAVAGSSADVTAIYEPSVAGGAVAGSSAIYGLRWDETGLGGALAGGAGLDDTTYVTLGGIVTGGRADQHIEYLPLLDLTATATMGLNATGPYVLGSAAFTAQATLEAAEAIYNASPTAALAASATITAAPTTTANPVTSGGAVAGGTARANKVQTATADLTSSATVAAAGNLTGRPTAALTASATITAAENLTASHRGQGGAVAGGTARAGRVQQATADLTASATLAAAASLTGRTTASLTASATVAAVENINALHTGQGGAVAGGVAFVGKATEATAALTASAQVAADPWQRFKPRFNFSASATITVAENFTASHKGQGGAVAGATATVEQIGAVVLTSGGASVGGTAAATTIYANQSQGGAVAGGTGAVGRVQQATADLTASATITAAPTLTARQTASGGAVAGSSALVSSNVAASASLTAQATVTASASTAYLISAALTAEATLQANHWQHVLEGLRDYLTGLAAQDGPSLSTLVGSRIYPQHIPQGAELPAICYGVQSNLHSHNLDGADGIAVATIDLTCVASSYQGVTQTANALRDLLHGYTGYVGAVKVLSSRLDDYTDDEEAGIYLKTLTFVIVYAESRPVFSSAAIGTTGDVEASIVAELSDVAPVYPLRVPQSFSGDIAIIYQRTKTDNELDLDGPYNVTAPEFELTVRGQRFGLVARAADRIRERLDGLGGQLSDTLAYSVVLADESTGHERATTGSDKAHYTYTLRFKIYSEQD